MFIEVSIFKRIEGYLYSKGKYNKTEILVRSKISVNWSCEGRGREKSCDQSLYQKCSEAGTQTTLFSLTSVLWGECSQKGKIDSMV